MSWRERVGGPPGAIRPFVPAQAQNDPQHDIADALDHIARAISAIDHNLEILLTRIEGNSSAVARLAASLERPAEEA